MNASAATPGPSPFRLVPWDKDFLPSLKQGIMEATKGRPGDAVVVFMHDRPRRYLTHLFRHDAAQARPCLLPRLFTVRELISAFREAQESTFRREARRLDRIALLSACVRRLAEKDSDLSRRLAETDEARFFPWGGLLADLMEECLTQGLSPDDLHHTEGETAPLGAALLASLGRIFQAYREALDQGGLTTPGFDAFTVAASLEAAGGGSFHASSSRAARAEAADLPPFLQGRAIFLAGFSTLSGTEESLFHFLWQKGAYIYLHGDAALAEASSAPFSQSGARPPKSHWACADLARWIADWNAPVERVCPPSGRIPKLHFFSGYDLHSQLRALRTDLTTAASLTAGPDSGPESTVPLPSPGLGKVAVVLPHSDALLPVLHTLPDKDCNISLGYPLERSVLFRLLESVLKIRAERGPDDSTHWRPLLALVRHPWLRLMRIPPSAKAKPAGEKRGGLRELLRRMEQRLSVGGRRVNPHVLLSQTALDMHTGGHDPESALHLAKEVLAATVDAWTDVVSLSQLADALASLCELLLNHGNDAETAEAEGQNAEPQSETAAHQNTGLWQRFPLDAECLYRLVQRVIPELKDNAMADTPLPWPLLEAMLLELVKAERVPFEADPLTGLQVLGMLETRLLRFSRVHLIDATDDLLPGVPVRNPLLPDSLRALLGLPDTRRREQVAAYTFHRLLAGADEVFLYWQEGVQPSGLFEGKKERSRLVEALIWQEEQARKQRLKPGEGPLRTASPLIRPPARTRRSVTKSPEVLAAMESALQRPWSPTRLDAYLTCPLRFYYEQVCGLRPPEDVNENDDPAAVGELVHRVLFRFYEPLQGKRVCRADLDEQALRQTFLMELQELGLGDALPPESAAMLRVAGPERLASFLRCQPDESEILHLEASLQCTIDVLGRKRVLGGTLDRVDRRSDESGQGAVILDYKTGSLKTIPSSIWKDESFWEMAAPSQGSALFDACLQRLRSADPEDDPLPLLAARLPSFQLPYYMYLYTQASGEAVLDAAYVALGGDGSEKKLWGDSLAQDARDQLLQRGIPDLIRHVLLHLELCPEFRAHEGRHCDWCSWNNLCIIPDREC